MLRLDVTLFSGFELLAMNGVNVDDTGNETDVHHGARGDRVWVVMNNVRSCVVDLASPQSWCVYQCSGR